MSKNGENQQNEKRKVSTIPIDMICYNQIEDTIYDRADNSRISFHGFTIKQ